MNKRIILFVIIAQFSAFGTNKQGDQGAWDLKLDVMSFNIRYGTAKDGRNGWSNRRALVSEVLKTHSNDVIGIQEALNFQIQEILADVPHLGFIGVGRDDGKISGEFAPIFYNRERFTSDTSGTFWFSETPAKPGSRSWKSRSPRICTWTRLEEIKSKHAFYIYNVHLDHWSQMARRNSVMMLIEHIANRCSNDPVIITGDFNASEHNTIFRYLKGELRFGSVNQGKVCPLPMVDSFRKVHPRAVAGTFNLFLGYKYGPKIDFIFTDPDTRVLDSKIIRDRFQNRYPSDHFPIRASLQLHYKGLPVVNSTAR